MAYHQRQTMLLSPGLDELIAVNHQVRVVDKVLSKKDIQPLPSGHAIKSAGVWIYQ